MRLLSEGRSLREVARMVGCEASSVMRWRDAKAKGGEAALRVRRSPGRPRRLTEAQRRRLVNKLLRGAMACGYGTELWTTGRVAEVIEQMFGVHYDRDHVGRMLHGLGWSHQKPARRALERNEEAIEQWKDERWPVVKKKLRGWVPISSS